MHPGLFAINIENYAVFFEQKDLYHYKDLQPPEV